MDFGYRVLGFFENGYRHISNRLRPVRTLADLKDMRVRLMPGAYRKYVQRARQSQRRFWAQPKGLARVLPRGFVARPAHILDMGCAAFRALKHNRASAARVSLC